jgi:gliding motility-associated-like protein
LPVYSINCDLGFGNAVITVTSPAGAGLEYSLDGGKFQTENIFSGVNNGTHILAVRNALGCTTIGSSFQVSCGCINPPALTLSSISGSTCGITPVTVSDNTFGGTATAVTIIENGYGTVNISSATVSPFAFTYTPGALDAGRTVNITVTTNNPLGSPCAAASAIYTLTVNANPLAPATGTITQPTCSVPTGSVIINGLPAVGTWTLTQTPGGETTGTGTSTTVLNLAPGTYTYIVQSAAGCISSPSGNVVINAQPATPSAPVIGTVTQPTCQLSYGSVALSGLPSSGNWTVTRLPGGITNSGTGTTTTVSSIPAGTYQFTVTANGCTSQPSGNVIINPQPVTPAAPSIGVITPPSCSLFTGSVELQGLPAIGEWTLTRYSGGAIITGTGTSTIVPVLATGTYNFTVTNAAACVSLQSANVVIPAQPATPSAPLIGTVTQPTFAVPSGSVVLSGLPASGSWILTRYPGAVTTAGSGSTTTVLTLGSGTYNFTVTNTAGCTSAQSADVVINPSPGDPVVIITDPAPVCYPSTVDITVAAVTAGSTPDLTFTYWTDPGALVAYATPAASTDGTYFIKGTTAGGFFTIKPVKVTVVQPPVADAGPDQVLDYTFGATMAASIVLNGSGTWSLVSGTGEMFNDSDPWTQVSGLSVGPNVFRWTVTNNVCLPVSDNVTIIVNDLIVPTLITPNLDGRNDYFVLKGIETLGKTEMIVFDRRGLKVYENSDYDNTWDGVDYNSNPLPDDTYFYILRFENGRALSGYIVIRR